MSLFKLYFESIFRITKSNRFKKVCLKFTAEQFIRQERRRDMFIVRVHKTITIPKVEGQSGNFSSGSRLPSVR